MPYTSDYLLEIGSEELPSAPLDHAQKQLGQLVADGLAQAGLGAHEAEVYSTPRRLAVIVHDVPSETQAISTVKRGPAASIAFDAEGKPTKAAMGFARGAGVAPEDLVVREEGGKEYVFAQIDIPAKPAKPLLEALSSKVIGELDWPRSQRWGSTHERYGRPVRWILALYGEEPLKVSYADVASGTTTRGHHVLGPGEHEVAHPSDYLNVLRDAYVLTQKEREEAIRQGIAQQEERLGLKVDTPKKVFSEVVNLCEWPTVLVGRFDEEFLDVPHEIICESMLSHQRYFPTYDKDGNLTRDFIVVGNGDPACSETIIDGNERVVRARLDDAKFFYEEDLKHPLDYYLPQLEKVTFQEKLGTLRQKVERMEALAPVVATEAGGTSDEIAWAQRAAHLAKADLVTQAVVEFTSQQGVMGGYYASAAGEPEAVATAITEHYRPRFAGDEGPSSLIGASVAIADKLDTIAGMFAIDEPPTGSSDPFAQRRSAIGIIHMLEDLPQVSLSDLIDAALDGYANQGLNFDHGQVAQAVRGFFLGRLAVMAKEQGISPDTVAAVSAVSIIDPAEFFSRTQALEQARSQEAELFEDLATAYARAANLANRELGEEVDESMLGDAERRLLDACIAGKEQVSQALTAGDYPAALSALGALRGPIDGFFEDVMVMDDDPAIRANRLKLLNAFAAIFTNVADFSELAKR
ncbi:glycine--tRNA ligase subunit beta [Leptogranulimonas caecicola]|uniref:glycine--tRNA ligase subunit beta n=1 Tax=Leptogranulimonas caecicola TaxID=2894156 RepID=UPI003512C88B